MKLTLTLTLTAASLIALSSVVSAGQELSVNEMDIVSAGGSAAANALADAVGNVTSTSTSTVANVIAGQLISGQLGGIYHIHSTGIAESAADSDAQAIGTAEAAGVTAGSLLSDTESFSQTMTNSGVGDPLPSATANSNNTSLASTLILGMPASASSASSAAALLQNGHVPDKETK